ncbi:hypothetical protein D9619_011302 [Psilocybe cf. subviscida]|uniref:Uncharacterized protein n=1 Tax=Psilocybe cf. subviscida TaxID=2480587 RepID=A0A8H5BJ05_9AGAR|nr:hypothetical protein D9619_011302 [Psilocybe cf. subviscida]
MTSAIDIDWARVPSKYLPRSTAITASTSSTGPACPLFSPRAIIVLTLIGMSTSRAQGDWRIKYQHTEFDQHLQPSSCALRNVQTFEAVHRPGMAMLMTVWMAFPLRMTPSSTPSSDLAREMNLAIATRSPLSPLASFDALSPQSRPPSVKPRVLRSNLRCYQPCSRRLPEHTRAIRRNYLPKL